MSLPLIFSLFLILFTQTLALTPTPSPWPLQFHSILFMNSTKSNSLSLINLWYDWPNGRNFNIIQGQLGGPPLHDLEWNNGTSFFYTLSGPSPTCRTTHFEVGILRPNWLDGAHYLGQEMVDGFLCNVWEKVDFIWYYEDVVTKRPVHWVFFTGMSAHVMTFEVGAVLEDANWQAPVYCFDKEKQGVLSCRNRYKRKESSFLSSSIDCRSCVEGSVRIVHIQGAYEGVSEDIHIEAEQEVDSDPTEVNHFAEQEF